MHASPGASIAAVKPLSIRDAASRFKGASPATVQRLVKLLETEDEEEAIVAFIIWMERSGFPASRPEIEDAANILLLRRNAEASPVSRMWYIRFRDDHPELQQSLLKAVEKSRESWEAGGIANLKQWFKQLTEAIRKYRINASECWNTDQAGIRIGILKESIKVLIVRTRRQTRKQVLSPSNRETCTLIGTGSASGDTIPPWLVFKAFPTLDWAYIDADPQMRFTKSETAFSNGEITLEWAIHFNRWSWEKSATVQSRGLVFEEWFGCDEHLRDPLRKYVQYDIPPISHSEVDGVFRLLVLDGFSGHGIVASREHCAKPNTIAAPLPPRSTHVLQPMDIGVFQPLENEHQKKLAKWLRKGIEKSGIYPPDPEPTMAYLAKKQLQSKKAVDPVFASLLPSEARFQSASDTAKHLSERYGDILSSPACAGLRQIRKVVTEAVMLENTVTAYVDDRRARIEKRYNAKKRGKRAKPAGYFSHNVSLQELRDQQQEVIAEDRQKEEKAQVRTARSFVIQEMKKMKDKWRQNKEMTVNGVLKRLSWAQWLEHTGKDIGYFSMESQRATTLPEDVKEAIHEASYAPKPLSAMDWTALARSDDSITFNLGQAAAADDDDEDDPDEEDDLPLIELSQRMA
ncbi:hypothetical protein MRS44_018475 [Fusarium solani]|uniref:uncharacterized protein n=1 Tax=Fusarium solani TaxID=169388 RepID=UPI0032C420A6|nr:hypothetical protein MRS44_018475 [Fusarium solani]